MRFSTNTINTAEWPAMLKEQKVTAVALRAFDGVLGLPVDRERRAAQI